MNPNPIVYYKDTHNFRHTHYRNCKSFSLSLYVDKRVKYISYVINDLVRKTEIDYVLERIKFPFLISPLHFPFPSIYFNFFSTFSSFLSSFSNYIKEMYGVPERMVNDIWDQYKNIIKDRVNG